MKSLGLFAGFIAAIAEVGAYRERVAVMRRSGGSRFEAFIPRRSQKKRRLIARRVGR